MDKTTEELKKEAEKKLVKTITEAVEFDMGNEL